MISSTNIVLNFSKGGNFLKELTIIYRQKFLVDPGTGFRKNSTSPMWFRIDRFVGDVGRPNDLITDLAI
jgi:hypothetical protein